MMFNSFKIQNKTISLELALKNCELIIEAPTISPKSAYLLSQTYFILENIVDLTKESDLFKQDRSKNPIEPCLLPVLAQPELLEARIIDSTVKSEIFDEYDDISFKEYDDYFSQDSEVNNNSAGIVEVLKESNISNSFLMVKIENYAKKIMPRVRKKLLKGDYSSQTLDTFHFLSFITKEDTSIVATIPWSYPENRYVSISVKDVVNLEKYKNEILLEYNHGTKRNT